MTHPMLGVWRKFAWGVDHLYRLKADVRDWFESDARVATIEKTFDRQASEFIFTVGDLRIRPEFSLAVGDIAHNFRSSLDYLAWYLIQIGSDPRPKFPWKVCFPIYDKVQRFANSVNTCLPGISAQHRKIVEDFQPYRNGRLIGELARLSNDDKHRELTLIFGQTFGNIGAQIVRSNHFTPSGVTLLPDIRSGGWVPIKTNTVLARMPGVADPNAEPYVEVEFSLSLSLAFPDGQWIEQRLNLILGAVTSILTAFDGLRPSDPSELVVFQQEVTSRMTTPMSAYGDLGGASMAEHEFMLRA